MEQRSHPPRRSLEARVLDAILEVGFDHDLVERDPGGWLRDVRARAGDDVTNDDIIGMAEIIEMVDENDASAAGMILDGTIDGETGEITDEAFDQMFTEDEDDD